MFSLKRKWSGGLRGNICLRVNNLFKFDLSVLEISWLGIDLCIVRNMF